MLRRIRHLPILIPLVGLIAFLVAFGPPERSLGMRVRVVYLHGAWVWTALAGFATAASAGAVGLAFRRRSLHTWSESFARAATIFWVTYLPISLVAMQANWNGLFLEEPRWRIGLDFAIVAVLLQVGLVGIGQPAWSSALNITFFGALVLALTSAQQVMHPTSPIIDSPSSEIRTYFAVLLGLCLIAGWQLARGLKRGSR